MIRIEGSMPYLVASAAVIGSGVACIALYRLIKPRISKRLDLSIKNEDIYESEKELNRQLAFHYGGPEVNNLHEDMPNDCLDFLSRCAKLCVENFDESVCSVNRALDLGCGVGRSTFELAKVFRESVGVDCNFGFMRTCDVLKKSGKIKYEVQTEGDLTSEHIAQVPDNIDRFRCTFRQGDACNLPLDIGRFGCVLIANLISRLPDPKVLLMRLKNLVAHGGICVIVSSYNFLRQYTDKSKWLGGYRDSKGREVYAFDAMRDILSPHFDLISAKDMSCFKRITTRIHEWSTSHATVWQRNQAN